MATHSYIGRGHQRNFVHKHINYLHHPTADLLDDTVYQAITIDISDDGMCMYIYHPAKEGDCMTVSHDMYSSPSVRSVVRWIKKIDNDLYKIGVSFESINLS